MTDMRTPWTLESDLKSTELTAVLDADGNRVAQWVPREKARLMVASPDLYEALADVLDDCSMSMSPPVEAAVRAALRRATGADQ